MEKKFLFKAKTRPTSRSGGHGGDERYNTKVDGQMHSGDAKIVDLIGEH
jgi:hypothetical protein